MWIGREAIRRTLWAYDGRDAYTPLARAIFARLGGTAEEVVAFATSAAPADYGRFVPLVLEHAASRDPLSMAILSNAATDAARIIGRLLDTGAPSVCLLGGLAEPLAAWLPPPLLTHLAKPKGDALDGAILMARRAQSEAPSAPSAMGA
jgi:glucosamine kinase